MKKELIFIFLLAKMSLCAQTGTIKVKKSSRVGCDFVFIVNENEFSQKHQIMGITISGVEKTDPYELLQKSNLHIGQEIIVNKDTLSNYLSNVCLTASYKLSKVSVRKGNELNIFMVLEFEPLSTNDKTEN